MILEQLRQIRDQLNLINAIDAEDLSAELTKGHMGENTPDEQAALLLASLVLLSQQIAQKLNTDPIVLVSRIRSGEISFGTPS